MAQNVQEFIREVYNFLKSTVTYCRKYLRGDSFKNL